jgi:hypothetical protein
MLGTYFLGLLPSGVVALLLRFGIRRLLQKWESRGRPAGRLFSSGLRTLPFAVAFAPSIAFSPPLGDKHGIGILLTASTVVPIALFERWPIPPTHIGNLTGAIVSLLVVWAITTLVILIRARGSSSNVEN